MPYRDTGLARRRREAALDEEISALDAELDQMRKLVRRRAKVAAELRRLRGARPERRRASAKRALGALALIVFAVGLGWSLLAAAPSAHDGQGIPCAVDGAAAHPRYGEWSGSQ